MSDEEAEKDRVLALPQTHDVRWWWVEGRGDMVSKTSSEDQFDRWLAAVKRETAAQAREEALKEAADAIGRVEIEERPDDYHKPDLIWVTDAQRAIRALEGDNTNE